MVDRDLSHQTSFLFRPEYLSGQELSIGSRAVEIVAEILRVNPDISRISVASYPIESTYKDGNSSLFRIARSLVTPTNLKTYSDSVFRSTSRRVETEDGKQLLVEARAVALASILKIKDGGNLHIPMLDFVNEIDMDELDEEEVFGVEHLTYGRRGYLLQTDNSLHFWGLDLLTDEEWKKWIQAMGEKYPNWIDGEFVEASLKRGYSCLRLFEYPPFKQKEPEVVSVIK